jgi:chlorobactene glucosyltransferase
VRTTTAVGTVLAGAWGAGAVLSVIVPGPTLHPDVARGRHAPSPLVSVVVPMRDEARNAAGIVRSVLAQDYDLFELVVVDDRSGDGTASAARAAGGDDPRLRIVEGQPLPAGWVGKPWACAQGAAAARGDWLVFCDADVRLHPAALRVLVTDAEEHDAQVVSWVGRQELGSFWERVVNPVVFFFIAGLTPLPLAQRPSSRLVAVNGQFLAFRRAAYERLGGHDAVADAIVEDLRLAQAAKALLGAGYRFAWARALLSTRMYTSLRELFEGWSKNVALGGAAVGLPSWGAAAGALVGGVVPWVGAARGTRPYVVAAACQALAIGVFGWRVSGQSPLWGLTAPLGTAAVTTIAGASWSRARRGQLRWRGRSYAARR